MMGVGSKRIDARALSAAVAAAEVESCTRA